MVLGSCKFLTKMYLNCGRFDIMKKTKDWALVQNAALVGVEVSLG